MTMVGGKEAMKILDNKALSFRIADIVFDAMKDNLSHQDMAQLIYEALKNKDNEISKFLCADLCTDYDENR